MERDGPLMEGLKHPMIAPDSRVNRKAVQHGTVFVDPGLGT